MKCFFRLFTSKLAPQMSFNQRPVTSDTSCELLLMLALLFLVVVDDDDDDVIAVSGGPSFSSFGECCTMST